MEISIAFYGNISKQLLLHGAATNAAAQRGATMKAHNFKFWLKKKNEWKEKVLVSERSQVVFQTCKVAREWVTCDYNGEHSQSNDVFVSSSGW